MEAFLVAFSVGHVLFAYYWSNVLTDTDPDLAYTASLGFATVGANNGHNGTGGYVRVPTNVQIGI